MTGSSDGNRLGRSLRAFLATLLVMSLMPGLVGASELPRDPDAPEPDAVASPRQIPRPGNKFTSTGFWAWSGGKRGYFLTDASVATVHKTGYPAITAVDLESGEVVGKAPLAPAAYAMPGADYAGGTERSIVVDEAGGRLFVATQAPVSATNVCGPHGNLATECFSGVSVVDGATLETVRRMPIRKVRADGTHATMDLLAMSFTPGNGERSGKLHVLVQEAVHAGGQGGVFLTNTRSQSAVLISLLQLDAESGAEDWMVRLDACRGILTSQGGDRQSLEATRHQAAILADLDVRRSVYVGCHLNSQTFQAGVVEVPLDDNGMPPVTPLPSPSAPGAPDGPPAQEDFQAPSGRRINWVTGPERVYEMIADPHSKRIVLQVLDGAPFAEVWWVFDTGAMRFVGTVGIGGPTERGGSLSAVDEGRLYVLARPRASLGRSFAGGLFMADIGSTPVSQALVYPEFANQFPAAQDIGNKPDRWALTVQRLEGDTRRFWFVDNFEVLLATRMVAIEDRRPVAPVLPLEDYATRSLDLDEVEGVTQRNLDGAARGYGLRVLLVGGADAAARVGPGDPVGSVEQCGDPFWSDRNRYPESVESNWKELSQGSFPTAQHLRDKTSAPLVSNNTTGGPCYWLGVDLANPCAHGDREVIFAVVGPEGPALVDDTGARGAAKPVRIDSATRPDVERPASRCANQDWDELWSTALFGRAPLAEPQTENSLDAVVAECVSGEAGGIPAAGDPVSGNYDAKVACQDEEASGYAYTRGFTLSDVSVAETLSSFRIYRDPSRGIVSRVESAARGVGIAGVLRIDTVRGVAESWANGRKQPVAAQDRDLGYDANCDMERSAGTCFRRHLMGVWTPEWSCGPCGDEDAFVEALDAVLAPLGAGVRLRDPDPRLRRGAESGFIAAIQKPEADRFGDMVLNSDLMQTVLPTLEIIRQAPPNRYFSRAGARGRQIYQFAGVEVSSSYGLQCLLVYDEATNTCAGEKQQPGAIQVSLSDPDGKALAGGAFEVRADVDADGVLGLKDTLLPDGACVTTDDGVGTCTFESLQPGTYLVNQVAAPPGYAKSAEPFVVELASGEQRTVAFTNVSNLSTVELKATDENGAPVSGAVFAAYPDPDADGKVAPDAKPSAECTTGADGACSMRVPAGSYVLVQTSAPAGLEGIEPVAFTFASGGQVAAVTVVNYPPEQPGSPAPEGQASPVVGYTAPVDAMPPTEIVDDYVAPDMPEAPETAEPPVLAQVGDTITQVIRAPGDALRLLARDPKEAVAWTAALALFALAVMAIRRRQQALMLITVEANRN